MWCGDFLRAFRQEHIDLAQCVTLATKHKQGLNNTRNDKKIRAVNLCE
jgi:hypothetical protein